MKIDAIKDGTGNIVISEDSFEMLLACLDNQKYVNEPPQNGDSLAEGIEYSSAQDTIQDVIDDYKRVCKNILHQKYIVFIDQENVFLAKKYEHQDVITPWSSDDVYKVQELFKDTEIKPDDFLKIVIPGVTTPEVERPWLIERTLDHDYKYLTVSEDGKYNRPWTEEERIKIEAILNNKL